MLLVIGAKNSSNSNRLRDLGKEIGTKSYLIDDEKQLNPEWLNGIGSIGITAGASAPEILVNQVIEHLKTLRSVSVKVMDGSPENVRFKLPPEVTGKVNLRAG
jgi:4-hydroxy-3-methylbut-2-enyl diphosphate reductase